MAPWKLSDGEITALIAGGFLVATKLVDWFQTRWGKSVEIAVAREQLLSTRISHLENLVTTKDGQIKELEAQLRTITECSCVVQERTERQKHGRI